MENLNIPDKIGDVKKPIKFPDRLPKVGQIVQVNYLDKIPSPNYHEELITIEVKVHRRSRTVVSESSNPTRYSFELDWFIDGIAEKDRVILTYSEDNNSFWIWTEASDRAWKKPAMAFAV